MKHRLTVSILTAMLLFLACFLTVSAQGDDPPTPTPSAEADLAPTPTASRTDSQSDSCYDCHSQLPDKQMQISNDWLASVHGDAGVGCAECHGGDPTTDEMKSSMSSESGFVGVPGRGKIPATCGGCHSDVERMRQYNLPTDQYSKYIESVHGAKLKDGETRVAVCTDCHGTHNVKKASDPSADVYPLNVSALCARCHSDPDLMEPFDIPTNQFGIYKTSVHGEALLQKQDMRAPSCTSCHGSHNAQPPTSDEVVNVCGKCHTATQNYYEQSLHSRLPGVAPKCWTCHGNHDVYKPDEGMFTRPNKLEPECSTCHDPDTQELFLDKAKFANREDRRCDTCHHKDSWIYQQVLALETAIVDADMLYKQADGMIVEAVRRGMIMNDAESKLAEARTSLISARAVVHTTKLPLVTDLTNAANVSAKEAQKMASEKLEENLIRRTGMLVAIGAIMINVSILYALKRRLYKELEQKE